MEPNDTKEHNVPTSTLSRDVTAAPAVVWDILIDINLLPSISPSTVAVTGPDRLEAVGDQFSQTVKLGGKQFTSTWTVTDFEPGRVITVTGSVLPGTKYSMTEEVTGRGRSGSTLAVTVEYSLPLGWLGRLAGRMGAERRALTESEQVVEAIAELAQERGRVTS